MKRTLILSTAFALLGLVFYAGTQMQAQQPGARPLQTRIGLVNMVQVLKNYKKFQSFETQIREKSKVLEAQLKPYRDQINKLRAEGMNQKTSAARRQELKGLLQRVGLDAKLKEEELKKELVKMNGEYAKQVYQEVEATVNTYARANNLELVLFYNDAVTREDFYHPETIKRKLMTPAALIPMMVSPGMDISDQIVRTLNAKFASSATPR